MHGPYTKYPWDCLLSLENTLCWGEYAALRKAVIHLPTLLPGLLAVSVGKLGMMSAMFLSGGMNPSPAGNVALEKEKKGSK